MSSIFGMGAFWDSTWGGGHFLSGCYLDQRWGGDLDKSYDEFFRVQFSDWIHSGVFKLCFQLVTRLAARALKSR